MIIREKSAAVGSGAGYNDIRQGRERCSEETLQI